MIVGVIGTSECVDSVIATLDKPFVHIDSNKILRLLTGEKSYSLLTRSYHKMYAIKAWENLLGNVVITGNLLLDSTVCSWLVKDSGNAVLVAVNDNNQNEQKRFYDFVSKHNKNVYLLNVNEECELPSVLIRKLFNANMCTDKELAKLSYVEDKNMTIEESIKKAMAELGMEVEQESLDTKKPSNTGTKNKKKISKDCAEDKCKDTEVDEKTGDSEDLENTPVCPVKKTNNRVENVRQPEETESSDDEASSLFVKVEDGSMAILIPKNLPLKSKSIAGMDFMVATVKVPDLSLKNLQELTIVDSSTNDNSVSKVVRKPILVEKDSHVHGLQELISMKKELDEEIKINREQGNEEKVSELRKKRRAIRNKINAVKND